MQRRGAFAGLVLFLTCCAPAWAAPPSFLSLERYTPDDGLSQNAITAMAEDDRGLLWVGTQEGLNRYDGHRFTVLRHVPGDPASLVSSSIESLAFDDRSRLWIGTNDAGLEVMDLRSRRRNRLGIGDGLGHPTVHAILLDPAGGAWLGTATGIAHVDPEAQSLQSIGTTAAIVSMVVSTDGAAHAVDSRCSLWRLGRSDIRGIPTELPPGATCVAMQPDEDGLWLATASDGVFRLDREGRITRHHPTNWLRSAPAELTAMVRRPSGGWLLGYSDGVLTEAPGDWREAPAMIALDRPIGSAISGFFQHRSGVLWIGSRTSGLFRARSLSAAIRRDLVDEGGMEAWPALSVHSIFRDGTRLLVGTDAGLMLRQQPGAPWQPIEGIGRTSIRAIARAARGGWWIGTHGGLWHLSSNGSARSFAGLPNLQVTDLLVEAGPHGEQVWIATRGGLAVLRGDRIETDALPPLLQGQFLTSLMRDDHARLWIGSNERGVFRIDPDGTVQHFGTHDGRLPHDSIWSLHADDNAIWLGSFAGGLLRLDRRTDRVTTFTERDGLSNNVIYRIIPDARGRLWLTTNRGISVLDPAAGVVQTLDRGDGLFNVEYNSGASFLDASGLLYLGGTDGLDIVDTRLLPSRSAPATPVITGLRVLGGGPSGSDARAAGTTDVVYAERVELDHRDRVVQLDLVATDFTAPNAARLRYRISGIYDDWVHPQGARASLLLSDLPSGVHALEVQAAGRDGRFGASRRMTLAISPPPWRHPLAYAAYALLALALVAWLLMRLRAHAHAKQLQIERLNRTVAEHTTALQQANRMLLRTNEQLEQATRTDPLTQVSNRRDLHEWLGRECPQLLHEITAPATASRGMLFCMIDLDHFKKINDSHGHQVGDEVLIEVARRLRQVCRERDILVRWGGEEFLLLVRDAHLEDAAGFAERTRQSIAEAPVVLANGHVLPIACSIGFAPWPLSMRWPSMGDWQQAVSIADMALYAAKASGRNAWVGIMPGPELDRPSLQALLAGARPEQLAPGSLHVLHSTPQPPHFERD